MKRLLITMFHLYFSERIIYGLVVIGGGLVAAAYIVPISPVLFILLSGTFIILIPWLVILLKFNILLSNQNLLMVPQWRQFVAGATVSLIAIFSGLLTLGISFSKKGSADHLLEFFLVTFCFSSLVAYVSKYTFGNLNMRYLFWSFCILLLTRLKFANNLIQSIDSTILISVTVLLSLIIWSRIAFTLGQAGKKPEKTFTMMSFHEYLSSKLESPSQLSAFNTFITGSVVRENSRISSTIVIYVAFIVGTVVLIKAFTSHIIQGEELLAIQIILIMTVPASAGESLARLRLLWLKLPGNRQQFWVLWQNNLHAALKLNISILVVIGALVYLIYDLSNILLSLYATITLILIPSFSYFTAWIRLKSRTKNILTIAIPIVAIGTIISLIISTLLKETYEPIFTLAVLSSFVGLFCYFRVKKDFLNLDWMVVKPINRNQNIFSAE